MIYKLKLKHKEKLNIKWMCEISGVSRSGYYNYVKNLTSSKYLLKEEKDKEDFDLIMQAYKFKNRHKGARAIKMTLERQYGIIMNLKKIRRLMRKFNLKCPIRKANPYRRLAKALKTNNYHDNKINREFYNGNPGEKLLTDITYIFYGPNRDVAYLSTIKDSVTTEILSYKLSLSLEEQFVLDTVNQLIIDNKVPITENTTLIIPITSPAVAIEDLEDFLPKIPNMIARTAGINPPQQHSSVTRDTIPKTRAAIAKPLGSLCG
jgi:hypothetical protein